MNISETAQKIGVTPSAVYAMIYSGKLSGELIKNKWDIDAHSVNAEIERRRELSSLEKYIVSNRPYETLQSIADRFGVSRQWVHCVEKKLDRRTRR